MIPPALPVKIAPSVLAADFTNLAADIRAVDAAGADYIHLDVMDGHFVPNISFGPALIKQLRPLSAKPFDVHLMIAPVDPLLHLFIDAGANIISVHPEAGPHLHRTLQTIKAAGVKAGLVLNPATPIHVLDDVMDLLDLILIMTVNPGFGGQSFIPLLDKIAKVRQKITLSGRNIDLELDGGITPETAPDAIAAGANVLVAGTAIFSKGAANYASVMQQLRGAA